MKYRLSVTVEEISTMIKDLKDTKDVNSYQILIQLTSLACAYLEK